MRTPPPRCKSARASKGDPDEWLPPGLGEKVFNALRKHIAVLDRDGVIIAVNRSWRNFAAANGGRSSGVGVGVSYLEACRQGVASGDQTAQQAYDGVRSVLAGRSKLFELEYPCDSPEQARWFIMHVFPIDRTSGRVVVSHEDISQLKAAQHEAKNLQKELHHSGRVAMLGELSASLAHELTQPLAAILANAQTMQRCLHRDIPVTKELLPIVADIIRDGKRAGEIVHRIRAQAKKEVEVYHLVSINQIVRDVANLVRGELTATNTKLVLRLTDSLPPVRAGVVELEQALMNLLINGIQAQQGSASARPYLEVSTRRGRQCVVLSVRDQGPGLSAEAKARMKQSFYTTKPGGLGLGLAFCRRIVENHGGRLEMRNHPQGGAVFRLILPVAKESSP